MLFRTIHDCHGILFPNFPAHIQEILSVNRQDHQLLPGIVFCFILQFQNFAGAPSVYFSSSPNLSWISDKATDDREDKAAINFEADLNSIRRWLAMMREGG